MPRLGSQPVPEPGIAAGADVGESAYDRPLNVRIIVHKFSAVLVAAAARAMKEAEALGLTSAPLKQFATNYVNTHK